MASIEATAAKRQRSLDRIGAALGIQFAWIHGDAEHRHACYLEQVADRLERPDVYEFLRVEGIAQDAPPLHQINECVTPGLQKEPAAPPPAIELPPLPKGMRVIGWGGGYVVFREPEQYAGPSGEWKNTGDYMDLFDSELEAARAAVEWEKKKPTNKKEKQHA